MKLSFERQFLLAGHALASVGVAALATTHEVSPTTIAAALGALGWSLARQWRRRGWQMPAQAANFAMLAALAVILAPVVLRGASPVRAIAEFLLVLCALKFVAAKESRDWMQIYVLSFFQLLAASALTVEPIFGLVFLAYLVLAPCVLVLFLLRREVGEAGGTRRLEEETFVEPSLFRSLAATTVVLFVSTLVVFVLFPRMGAGYFAAPFAGGAMLTGFSEEVGLGGVAALKQDDAIALRVAVDRPDLFRGRLYWRGAALDHFDGRTWKRRPQELRPLLRAAPGVFELTGPMPRGPLVNQEIVLEPQDSAMMFFAGRPREVRGRFLDVSTDPLGNLRVLRPTGVRTRYQVLATLSPRRTTPTLASRALPPIDSRIAALARAETRDAADDRARAEALLGYLQRGFLYTLSPGDPGTADPLARFLFETKRGHCEYFASAYAVMLRTVGIPALVVNGYAGGEWNPYGGYFLVRQRDAHSWVEAYLDGEWQVFDPTPASAAIERGLGTRIADMIDAAQMRWYRYVINYTLEDQAEAALSLRDASRRIWQGLTGEWWKSWQEQSEDGSTAGERRFAWRWLLAVVFAVLVAWLWRSMRGARRRADEALSEASRQYARLLRFLEGLGLTKHPGETAPEFCRRIGPRMNGESERLERLTSLYEEARFSGRDVAPGPLDQEVEAVIASLSRRSSDEGRPAERR